MSASAEREFVASWAEAAATAMNVTRTVKMTSRPLLDTRVAHGLNPDCFIGGFGLKKPENRLRKAVLMPVLFTIYDLRVVEADVRRL
jgi:hypothetical protein